MSVDVNAHHSLLARIAGLASDTSPPERQEAQVRHTGSAQWAHHPGAHDPAAGPPRVWQEHPACCPSWQAAQQ